MPDQLDRLKTALADRYTIERELGAGGMATVFLAEDLKHKRKVALKVLKPELAAVLGAERFVREIGVAARLNHPHIVPLLDSGQADGMLYFTMPLLTGPSLAARIRESGPLGIEEIRARMTDVASALDYAHAQGIVHRDLKPENVLMHHGKPMIADFGIAHAVGQVPAERLTETGLSIGTPQYMSPEQVSGDRTLDARSDVYAIGCVVYEMVVGDPPFTGSTAQAVMARQVTDPAPPIRTVRRDVPAAVDAAVTKALAKVPGDRFGSVGEFVRALTESRAAEREVRARPQMTTADDRPTVAVLPFENLSPDPDNAFFSDGITEDVITQLSKIHALKVISRASSMRYRDSTVPPGEIAAALGVNQLVYGSVRYAGGRVRITARLINAHNDRELWAESYDREMSDVFAIQSEVAHRIAGALRAELTPAARQRLDRKPTEDMEAYRQYLLGRHHWARWTEEDFRQSIWHFEAAVESDPGFAEAYTALSEAWSHLGTGYWTVRPLDAYPKARDAATRAIELDPDSAEAHARLAMVEWWFEFAFERALDRVRHATLLNPNSASAFDYQANLLTMMGDHDEALALGRRACELDPASVFINANYALFLYRARMWSESIDQFQRVIDLDPNLPMGHGLQALVHVENRDLPSALAGCQRAEELSGGHHAYHVMLGYGHAAAGNHNEARGILAEVEAQRGQQNVWLVMLAMGYTKLGEPERALDLLEDAYRERGGWIVWAGVEPGLDELRGNVRFRTLLGRLGLPQADSPSLTGSQSV